nr:hypothetical protein KitaXyl93_77800 [Kitasatospora sp. Xyl93]
MAEAPVDWFSGAGAPGARTESRIGSRHGGEFPALGTARFRTCGNEAESARDRSATAAGRPGNGNPRASDPPTRSRSAAAPARPGPDGANATGIPRGPMNGGPRNGAR